MKSRHPFINILAVLFMFPLTALLARGTTITIEVLATFDYPGTGNLTRPQKINDAGDIAGEFFDSAGVERGFTRSRNGHFSLPIVDPNGDGSRTDVRAINDQRVLCGYYLNGNAHGFFLSGNTFTEFDIPDALNTYIYALTNAGDFAGTTDFDTGNQAYVSIAGTVTLFSVPGALTTSPFGMNNLNQIVGEYLDSASVIHGFFRDADGTLTFPIDPAGSTETEIFGINDRQWMVGRYTDGAAVTHGLFFVSPTRFIVFDYPGSTFTSLNGINQQGLVCGRYLDTSGIEHGILARASRTPID